MESDLSSVVERLQKQVARLEDDLSDNMRKMRDTESRVLFQLNRIKDNLGPLSTSPNWMNKLLYILDMLCEAEKFVDSVKDIEATQDQRVEDVSLESLMEYDASVSL